MLTTTSPIWRVIQNTSIRDAECTINFNLMLFIFNQTDQS